MNIPVLVVSYGVKGLLERCLASLREDGWTDVVVVDNASPDGSAEMVRARFPWVRLIALTENRGFSAAVNLAAAAATGDALFVLNPDTVVPVGTRAGALRSLRDHPEAAAVGFRQVDEDGTFQLSVGLQPGFATELLRCIVQRRLDSGDRKLAARIDRRLSTARPIAWVSGATLLVRRDAFDAVGGFDEGFFLYFEDIDFCLRVGRSGRVILYDPSVTVLHHRGESARTNSERAAREYRRSQLRFWEKHSGRATRRAVRLYQKVRGCEVDEEPAAAQTLGEGRCS
ncbi:MAG: glycosyltransferase family 2 protein [Candidatus Eiseniibacteriota bacterium]